MSTRDDCIFCAIASGSGPAQLIAENDHAVAFLDIAPATRGHTLVIPKEHSDNLLEIDPTDLAHVVRLAQEIARKMPGALGADGVNLLNSCGSAAWQTVFHTHVHVIPRYVGDPLKLPWREGEVNTDGLTEVAELLR
ncbi:MAG: HIT family protein [Solirubrobacterales bacterium]